ncbi:MAG: hypothetical protein J6A75_03465 [Lachnospiraceae bacterium]|nr:hypothetical protein [Lachnospiraceae bacterium]
MKNDLYKKIIEEDFGEKSLTLLDFIKVCDTLGLTVFEHKIIRCPVKKMENEISNNIYSSMSQYRQTMPDWSAREYDYDNDRATAYLMYQGIKDGEFSIEAENSSTYHKWIFSVVGQCVVVHYALNFID